MEKLKVLIVSRSFHPMISPRSFRTTELVKEYCKQGHAVTLVTHVNNDVHHSMAKEFGFNLIDLGKSVNVQYTSQFKIFNKLKYLWIRLLGFLIEYPNVLLSFKVKRVLSRIEKHDLMISIAAPHSIHWGVAWARTKQHRIADVWIADCGDAFMGNHLDRVNKMFYFSLIEKWFCRKADAITLPNINMKISYYPEFHPKIHEVTQGFDFSESERSLGEYKPNATLIFGYSGAFFQGRASRDPRPFLAYILSKDIDFEFHIFTKSVDLISDFIQDKRIITHTHIPRLDLLNRLSKFDFLVNIAYDPATQSPSKLIDYSICKRPILNIYDDRLNDEIRSSIDAFLKKDYKNSFVFDEFEKFNIVNVVSKFNHLYGALINE